LASGIVVRVAAHADDLGDPVVEALEGRLEDAELTQLRRGVGERRRAPGGAQAAEGEALHRLEAVAADGKPALRVTEHELARWRELRADADLAARHSLQPVAQEVAPLLGILGAQLPEGAVRHQLAVVVVVVGDVQHQHPCPALEEAGGRQAAGGSRAHHRDVEALGH
jgi:hypothetical protein